jgi:K+ transporter
METLNGPQFTQKCGAGAANPGGRQRWKIDTVGGFLARESIGLAQRSAPGLLRRHVFIILQRNAQDAAEFFHIPAGGMAEPGLRMDV